MMINRVTMLGHKDHGKSTLIGSLLIATDSVSEERLNEAKAYSKKLGRKFEPCFILDSFSEERKGGLTIDTSRAQIKYKDSAFEFIDVPGHEELIKNMISGASYASTALLVVSANGAEGIKPQTKRHVYLAKMLGIEKLIVAVNKMDTVGYSKTRFDEMSAELTVFFKMIGMEEKHIHLVPISAYNFDNLMKKSPKMKWYKGKPLLEMLIESTKQAHAAAGEANTRILIQGSMPHGEKTMLIGNVASGRIKVGTEIKIMPSGQSAKIKSLFVKGLKKDVAASGKNVAIELDKSIAGDSKGMVIYEKGSEPSGSAKRLDVLVFIVKRLGSKVTIKFNGIEVKGSLNIKKLIDTTSGKEEAPRGEQELNAADAEIRLTRLISAEPFVRSRELGRFVIYQKKEFSGIGIINRVY